MSAVTANLLASQVPVPTVPSAPPDQLMATDSTTTAASYEPLVSGTVFDPAIYNRMTAQTASGFLTPGGVGVLSGFIFTVPGSGLLLAVGQGWLACTGAIQIEATTIVVPDATALVFIWALQNGTLAYTTTTTPPAANCSYIGNVTTSGGDITNSDFTGVCYVVGPSLVRYTADLGAPTDTPLAGTTFYTITAGGTYFFDGEFYQSTGTTAGAVTTASTVTLNTGSPKTLYITPGANIDVLLPLTPTPFTAIYNSGLGSDGFTLTLKDSTGSHTYATIDPGWYVQVILVAGGGSSTPQYQVFYTPINSVTSVSVIDSGGAAISAGTVTFNLTSGGGPVILAECVVGLPGAVVTQDYNGVGVTPVPLGTVTQGALTVTLFYLLSNAPGTHAVVFTYTGGPNVYVLGVSLDAPSTVALGAVGTDNNASASSSNIPLSAALGSLVVDAILSPGVLTSTQTSEATGTISGDNCAMSVALGNGGTTTMGYGIAPASAYAMAGVVLTA